MAEEKSLIDKLRATRPGYRAERVWHKFLMDAYAGTGGFEGAVRMPFASYWGAAADIYSRNAVPLGIQAFDEEESKLDTYLDRFLREDMDKFRRRQSTAQYPNYIEPILDIRLSFMHRKEYVRDGVEALGEWLQDVDGLGTSWEEMRKETIDFRAALFGWCPVLFDRTQPVEGYDVYDEISREQARQAGIRTNAIPLYPANVLDWSTDSQGVFEWVKLTQWEVERPDPLGPATEVQYVDIWTRDFVQRFRIIKSPGDKEPRVEQDEPFMHQYGKVPLLIARGKRAHDDPIKGLPAVGGPAKMARKLFNYLSELDEHIRSSVFAFLQVPQKRVSGDQQGGEIVLGEGNALGLPMDSSRDYKYISPDPSVAATLENRVTSTVEEIYRTARTEFARAQIEGRAESGAARLIAFENTNRVIADFAAAMGRFDERALRCVAEIEMLPAETISAIRVTAPKRFDIEEMSRELDEALTAVTLQLGPTATAELKKRLIAKLLPNLDDDIREQIEEELAAQITESAQADAFDQEQDNIDTETDEA